MRTVIGQKEKLDQVDPATTDLDCVWINLKDSDIPFLNVILSRLPNLVKLDLSYNYLTVLPELPFNLQMLNCNNNHISIIDNLPTNLTHLSCKNNVLKHILLSNNHNKIEYIDCSNELWMKKRNKMTRVPYLLNCNNLHYVNFDNNERLPDDVYVILNNNDAPLDKKIRALNILKFMEPPVV